MAELGHCNQYGASAERPMTTSRNAPIAVTALMMPTSLVHYMYKPPILLESSYFYSKSTDEFKSANVDEILTMHTREKKQINVISPILQK